MTIEFEKTLYDGPFLTYGAGPGGWVMFRALNNDLQKHWEKADMPLSESRYLLGLQCPKAAWLVTHSLLSPQSVDQRETRSEHDALDLVRRLTGDHVGVQWADGDSARTLELLDQDNAVIVGARFYVGKCVCTVDILRKDPDGGLHVVMVVASQSMKDVHLHKIAYQVWVLNKWGFSVKSATLKRVFDSKEGNDVCADSRLLSTDVDVTGEVMAMQQKVSENVERMRRWASLQKEPGVYMDEQCDSPSPCDFKDYCAARQPNMSQ